MIELLEKRSSELFSSAVSEGALEDGIFATRKTAYRRFFKGGKSRDVSFSGNNNTATNRYQVVVGVAGGQRTLNYDLNGNCTSDGTKTYDWDAANRMVKITQGANVTEFEFDGLGRRVRIVEKESDVVVSDKRFVWVGTEIAEERDATGANATKRFFPQGVQTIAYNPSPVTSNLYYTRDHLGSIREVTDSSSTVVSRYDWDPYGRRTLVSGTDLADFGFTGHYFHAPSGLHLAMYRAYDAELGRWLSRDPIGEERGLNLYVYVASDPINYIDPLGLDTYRQNRQLNPKGFDTRKPVEHFASHTFLYTTNPDGSLQDTYSWGNEYDKEGKGSWFKNRPEDRCAAEEAIRQRKEYESAPWWKKPFTADNFGPRVGDESMDQKVEDLYQKKSKDPKDSSRHPFKLNNNCKHEADCMVKEATK